MAEQLLLGQPPVKIHIRRNARARRLTLRVNQNGVHLTMPKRFAVKEAERFAREKLDWIRSKLEAQPATFRPGLGDEISIKGQSYFIEQGQGRICTLSEGAIRVPGDASYVRLKIKAFLKELARDELSVASDVYAQKIGRSINRITLRDTRSRWGSCSSTGSLMYSWRLIMAPPHVLDYVAAHEVAHLVEMNHSQAFWDIVAGLRPDFSMSRQWLKDHGASLHRYDFDA